MTIVNHNCIKLNILELNKICKKFLILIQKINYE